MECILYCIVGMAVCLTTSHGKVCYTVHSTQWEQLTPWALIPTCSQTRKSAKPDTPGGQRHLTIEILTTFHIFSWTN